MYQKSLETITEMERKSNLKAIVENIWGRKIQITIENSPTVITQDKDYCDTNPETTDWYKNNPETFKFIKEETSFIYL